MMKWQQRTVAERCQYGTLRGELGLQQMFHSCIRIIGKIVIFDIMVFYIVGAAVDCLIYVWQVGAYYNLGIVVAV